MNRNSYDYSILVVLELQQWLYGTLIVTVTITYFNFISLVFIQVTKLGNYIRMSTMKPKLFGIQIKLGPVKCQIEIQLTC